MVKTKSKDRLLLLFEQLLLTTSFAEDALKSLFVGRRRFAYPGLAGEKTFELLPDELQKQYNRRSGLFFVIEKTPNNDENRTAFLDCLLSKGSFRGILSVETAEKKLDSTLIIAHLLQQKMLYSSLHILDCFIEDLKFELGSWFVTFPTQGLMITHNNKVQVGSLIFTNIQSLDANLVDLLAQNTHIESAVLENVQRATEQVKDACSGENDVCVIVQYSGDVEVAILQAKQNLHAIFDCLYFLGIWDGLRNRYHIGIAGSIGDSSETVAAIDSHYRRWKSIDRMLRIPYPMVLNEEKIQQLQRNHLDRLCNLVIQPHENKSTVGSCISQAVRWLARSYRSDQPLDQFLFAVIALELLIVPDGKAGEIGEKLSLRVALLLGASSVEKRNVRKNVKWLYNLRSTIAHKGTGQVTAEDANSVLIIGYRCVQAILDQFPDDINKQDFINQWETRLFMEPTANI